MNNREEFEKWCVSLGVNPSERMAEVAYFAWQARQPEIDVLRQERDELIAQVEVKDAALCLAIPYIPSNAIDAIKAKTTPLSECYANTICNAALSITPSEALREVEARVLEEAADRFWKCSEGDLREMAAAKRKGE